jgi:hypothetical protein
MPKYRIISQPLNNKTKREEIYLNDYEERKLRLSHGLYEFLNLDILPTETHLVAGQMGLAFIKLWKLRKRKKDIFSIGMIKDM